MEVDYKAIGQRIKIARIKKGVTQETVADLIDITPAHMSNVETGKTKVSLPTLIAIANALSVSVDTLLCDNVIASKIVFEKEGLNHKFCGISDSSRSSVGSYRIASERNIRHQDIRIPVCEES